jgi:CubicO group peptidase (beta-lactamase class C family)
VRQLLQHTSGLPEYIVDLLDHEGGLTLYWAPRDILDMALTHHVQSILSKTGSRDRLNAALWGLRHHVGGAQG